jgi:plastocyanin
MPTFRVRASVVGRFALILLLMLGAISCKERISRRTVTFTCGDRTVDANTNNGAQPQAVYVCEGDTVTWRANRHTFQVEFKKDSPFENNEKRFDNQHSKSDKAKHFTELTVYEYRITVDGTPFDPQVIGGGGN